MTTPTHEDEADPYTGYRIGTRNLIVSGVHSEADRLEHELKAHDIPLVRFGHPLPYTRFDSLHPEPSGFWVYLVEVEDLFGTQLREEARRVEPHLRPFDTVEGIFRFGGPQVGAAGVQVFRRHGRYSEPFLEYLK